MGKGVPALHPEEKGALNWSPRANWVDRAGGLPAYINSVAVALVRGGMPRERAIPTAVNVVRKTCATGHWRGDGKAPVSPAIRAAACKAAAEWEAKKTVNMTRCSGCGPVNLSAFDPARHPRDPVGRFALKIGGLRPGDRVNLPTPVTVRRHPETGRLHVTVQGKTTTHPTAESAARKALAAHRVLKARERLVDRTDPKLRRVLDRMGIHTPLTPTYH